MPIPLMSYVQEAKKDLRKAFLERNPHPVLVVDPFKELNESDVRFDTVDAADASGAVMTVAPVAKRAGANAFAQMITIGRASNNDIIISGAGVSKFHAYLMGAPGKTATLIDGRSTYGTYVRGEKIKPGERVEVRPGDAVKFGMVSALYLDPPGFWDFLKQVLANPDRVKLSAT